MMRTTVSLDPDVARLIEQRMHERKEGFKKVLNDMLRRGFSNQVAEPIAAYQVPVFNSSFEPGIDTDKINQVLDEPAA